VSKKTARIAELIESCQGQQHDAHYLGFFECFNRGYFYEAHDVLEELWLIERKKPNDAFYKGLIQLAGAFVHLQKNRLRPAGALFKLAKANLQQYPSVHFDLEIPVVLQMIEDWLKKLETGEFQINPLESERAPELHLRSPDQTVRPQG
jgi:predicted metal-dependent hydrolase